MTVSQKVGDSNHFLSFNYENNKGRTINDKSNRFSLYYKSNYAITSWLNVNAGVDARLGRSDTPNSLFTGYTLQQRYERILAVSYTHLYIEFST